MHLNMDLSFKCKSICWQAWLDQMSIPIYFDFYDAQGRILARNRSFFTISYTQRPGDLTMLSNRIQECSLSDHQRYVHADVRYIVPTSAADYMFDLQDPSAILPNKFKETI